jgi:hypothetical protein
MANNDTDIFYHFKAILRKITAFKLKIPLQNAENSSVTWTSSLS